MSTPQDVFPSPAMQVTPATAPRRPLMVCSPHSGRHYPEAFIALSRLDRRSLRRSEDFCVDELCAGAPGCGAPLLSALFPRAFVDVNREPWELDPAMFAGALPSYANTRSTRVAAGLGSVARVVAEGEPIYRAKLAFEDVKRRIEQCWFPYHETLRGLMTKTRDQFGVCVLLDAHSMPSAGPARESLADVVLGDRHGAACAAEVINAAERAFHAAGWRVARNAPYAGGYVTAAYGRPHEASHALQIEISRALYMDEARIEKAATFDAVRDTLTGVFAQVAEAADHLAAARKKRGRANAARV